MLQAAIEQDGLIPRLRAFRLVQHGQEQARMHVG
jgi:hypothetical protein